MYLGVFGSTPVSHESLKEPISWQVVVVGLVFFTGHFCVTCSIRDLFVCRRPHGLERRAAALRGQRVGVCSRTGSTQNVEPHIVLVPPRPESVLALSRYLFGVPFSSVAFLTGLSVGRALRSAWSKGWCLLANRFYTEQPTRD